MIYLFHYYRCRQLIVVIVLSNWTDLLCCYSLKLLLFFSVCLFAFFFVKNRCFSTCAAGHRPFKKGRCKGTDLYHHARPPAYANAYQWIDAYANIYKCSRQYQIDSLLIIFGFIVL